MLLQSVPSGIELEKVVGDTFLGGKFEVEEGGECVEKGSRIFAGKLVLEGLPDGRRRLVCGDDFDPLGIDRFQEITRGDLVPHGIVVDIFFGEHVPLHNGSFHWLRLGSQHDLPATQQIQNILTCTAPFLVVGFRGELGNVGELVGGHKHLGLGCDEVVRIIRRDGNHRRVGRFSRHCGRW